MSRNIVSIAISGACKIMRNMCNYVGVRANFFEALAAPYQQNLPLLLHSLLECVFSSQILLKDIRGPN